MKYTDYLNISPEELNRMSIKELSKTNQILNDVLRKRIKRMENSGLYSPALHNKDIQYTKNKTLNQLRQQYVMVNETLQQATSTIKGAKQMKVKLNVKITGDSEQGLTKKQEKKLWDTYSKLNEMRPEVIKIPPSTKILNYIYNRIIQGKSKTDILEGSLDLIDTEYENIMEESEDDDFFTL